MKFKTIAKKPKQGLNLRYLKSICYTALCLFASLAWSKTSCDYMNLYNPVLNDQLPRQLIPTLEKESCLLQNTDGVVAVGEFKVPGVTDVAVLCILPDGGLKVFVFTGSDPSKVEAIVDWPDSSIMERIPLANGGCAYNVFLYPAPKASVLAGWGMSDGGKWPSKEDIITDGINFGCCDKSPFTTYWNAAEEKWDCFYNSGC